jgi:hypothetical protein
MIRDRCLWIVFNLNLKRNTHSFVFLTIKVGTNVFCCCDLLSAKFQIISNGTLLCFQTKVDKCVFHRVSVLDPVFIAL